MSNSEIGNVFKKNYKVEKYRDSLCRKLVSLNGDEVDYKVIFGPKLEMVNIKEKKKESNYDIMESKLRLKNIVKLYELSFNKKLKKYSSKYLKDMFNLLNQNDKDYIEKRKLLFNNNKEQNFKLDKENLNHLNKNNLTINHCKNLNSQNSFFNDFLKKSFSTKNYIKSKEKKIVKNKSSIFKEYVFNENNKENIFNKLKGENKFFEKYSESEEKINKVIQKIRKIPKLKYLNISNSLKEKTIERMKKSSSCENHAKNNLIEKYYYKDTFSEKKKTLNKDKKYNSSLNIIRFPSLKTSKKNILLIGGNKYDLNEIENSMDTNKI